MADNHMETLSDSYPRCSEPPTLAPGAGKAVCPRSQGAHGGFIPGVQECRLGTGAGMLWKTRWELQQEIQDWEAGGRHSLHAGVVCMEGSGGVSPCAAWNMEEACSRQSTPTVEQDCPVVACSCAHILAPQKGPNIMSKPLAGDAEKGRFEEQKEGAILVCVSNTC